VLLLAYAFLAGVVTWSLGRRGGSWVLRLSGPGQQRVRLAPGMLHPHRGHAEAVARITWLVSEHAIGVVTGEVGAGKTIAARAAVATLDPVGHTIVYLPTPASASAASTPRSSARSAATPASTKPRWSPRPPSCWPPKKPRRPRPAW
jgi:hypothetical protein